MINAASKDAAYTVLKSRGIKPGRVEEAPGFFNKLFGKGKRWIAIGILSVIAIGAIIAFVRMSHAVRAVEQASMQASVCEERSQLFGDPVVIRECEDASWTNVFTAAFDIYLAQYAIPGRMVGQSVIAVLPSPDEATRFVEIGDKDLVEVARMKRMVNGMKMELSEYLADGGTLASYMNRLNIRQRAERGIFESVQRQIQRSKDHAVWKEKNAELRAMGLPMVEAPDPVE